VKKEHGRPHSLLVSWLAHYEFETPGVETYSRTTVILDTENEVQPDAAMVVSPSYGGKGELDDDYFLHAPELIVEVSNMSANIDLGGKFESYRRNEAQEYLVHRVRDSAVDWFELKGGVYEPLVPDKHGILRSRVFPGLWLDIHALLKRDLKGLVKTLDAGLASPEHAAFCVRLEEASARVKKPKASR
jgi:Uma2 family endonuclease